MIGMAICLGRDVSADEMLPVSNLRTGMDCICLSHMEGKEFKGALKLVSSSEAYCQEYNL